MVSLDNMEVMLIVNKLSVCSSGLLVLQSNMFMSLFYQHINLLDPKSDQHLISLFSNSAESFIKFIRIKEMITYLKKL